MRSPGINGEGELMEQLANVGSSGKMPVKTVCVCATMMIKAYLPLLTTIVKRFQTEHF